jgi:CHASE2 domain-containing sensor protein/signal transduction histidine kinase
MTAARTAPTGRRDDIGVALVVAVLAFVLAAGGWLWRADRLVYDAALALWTRPAPDDVVIVAIDDASIEAIGRWPWKRSVHATLLQTLADAGPRALVLDLVLSESDPDPVQDELLAAALRRAAPVVLPVAWQAAPGAPLRVLEPVPLLRAEATLGAAEAAVDADGVLRHAFAMSGPPDQPYPHLALAALRAGGQLQHEDLAIEHVDPSDAGPGWRRQGRFLIRYLGPPGHVRHVSYVDVLRGAVAVDLLRGRYLLVGMTAQGLGDTLATPVNARQRAMPGVEVLAHTLTTLRSGQAPRAWPPWASGAVSALAALLLVLSFGYAGTRPALVLALASLPVALLASVLALRAGQWCSPASFMLAAALAYPLWSWRRLERGVDLLDREIARLAAEPGLLVPAVATVAAPRRDRLALRLAALHNAAETLRSARRFLADALAGLPTAVLVDDGTGRVLLGNPLAAQLFEVESAADLQGLDLARLLAEFDCQPRIDWPPALQQVRTSGDDLAVQAHLAGQGDHVIHAHGVPMAAGTHLVVAIADVAPIKQAERARDELLAFVSHDLRSPATSIDLLAELHLSGRSQLSETALLHEVQRLARRTLALADDFVRVSQAAQRPLQRVAVDVGTLLAEVAADFAPQALTAGVTVEVVQPDPGRPPHAGPRLDRDLVQRALGNLLSNALQASPAQAVVRLAAHPGADAGDWVFELADQGVGLSDEAMRRLMHEHDGLVPSRARGVGFGLLFVQRVAQRHGGRLQVRAGAGGVGAVFELVIGDGSGNA